ncbi:class I SAM-dependent methyltransferase [Longispora albida]|uniref:class I SAM-dependent methyltransferase n=1 Tax=Longispora albida TaxID=203523 RepID=UPI00037DC76C|nr:class I SAM-dependent methyltransferase [Longispora albida]
MSLFDGTADFYQRFRSGVPEELAAILDAAAAPGEPRRLLDLGTGTGLVVDAMAGRFDEIIAVDPDPRLLAVAEATARPAMRAGTSLTFTCATAEEFRPPAGWQADLVTICRAFHWMDQPAVLDVLSTCVAPDGAVAIAGDRSLWRSATPWKVAIREVVQDFPGPARRAGNGVFSSPDRPYLDILAESAFSVVEEMTVPVRRTRTTGNIVGYLHSTSYAAPHLFGDRLAEFDQAVTDRLSELSPDGNFVDENEYYVLIARR